MLQRERDDLLDTARRLQADFENYRKRVLREQTALVDRATEGLSSSCFRCSTASSSRSCNLDGSDVDEKVRKGIELAFAELTSVLERAGLERIDARGRAVRSRTSTKRCCKTTATANRTSATCCVPVGS